MKIGLVLSSAPAYSETFFNSKIKGLQEQGHEVTLFCSVNENNFSLCDVKLFSRQYRNPLKQVLTLLYVYIGLFPYLKSILKFCKIERQHGVAWTRIAKRIYTYAPIFKSPLHWLHFGFGTLVLGCENLAAAKQSKMAVSFRGFDIGVYPIKNPNCYARLWETVDKIHVISNDIKQLLYSNGFKDQAPIVKITPAINTQYFSVSKQKQYTNPVQLITVARLHWKKGLHYTLEALALLKAEGIPFRYNI
ncbi:MAG: glycosyltransferase, partial [Oceanihabitans sp.]